MDKNQVKRAGRRLRSKPRAGAARSPRKLNRSKAGRLELPAHEARTNVTINGHNLVLSNLAKVFYPAISFTKGQVIDYYARVSGALLP